LESSVRARYVEGNVGDKSARGYLAEDGVPADSDTETFVAIRAEIDSWRWAGVPILLRHGKRPNLPYSSHFAHFLRHYQIPDQKFHIFAIQVHFPVTGTRIKYEFQFNVLQGLCYLYSGSPIRLIPEKIQRNRSVHSTRVYVCVVKLLCKLPCQRTFSAG
jgi:hypothetical protein